MNAREIYNILFAPHHKRDVLETDKVLMELGTEVTLSRFAPNPSRGRELLQKL
jgi:hypothetical protein